MLRSGKNRWTARTVALPLSLSLLVHGVLFSVLWWWPTSKRGSPTLTIQSTRILLDTCVLDSPASALLVERDLPPDLLGTPVDTTLAPRLEEPASPPKRDDPLPYPLPLPFPNGRTGNQQADERGTGIGIGQGKEKEGQGSGSLFPVPAMARSVVFVLDRSMSMAFDRKLDLARRELIASLRRLPATVRFQVIDYNDHAETLVIDGQRDLLLAEPAIVAKAVALLQALDAAGKTNHLAALRQGIDLHPDVLYFLTDANDLKPEEVAAITRRNQRTIVHTIELTRRRATRSDGPLVQLAHENHGTYRRVWLSLAD